MCLLGVVSLHGIFAVAIDNLIQLVGRCVFCNTITATKSWNGIEPSLYPDLTIMDLFKVYMYIHV